MAPRPDLPLNALRAFEASARLGSFTKAARELCVTQAAISHHVKGLEERLGARLFHRSARGLMLSDEGVALLPTLTRSFDSISRLLDRFQGGRLRDPVALSVVSAFALGWLMPRLASFREAHPFVDLRLLTNNNRADLAAEALDGAILFGDGSWPGADATRLLEAPLSPLCPPDMAKRLKAPADLARVTLLRSYRTQDWPAWFAAAGLAEPPEARGHVFDSSPAMVQAALMGEGVALAPPLMFQHDLAAGRLVRPFAAEVATGAYWLVRSRARPSNEGFEALRLWLLAQAG